MKICDYCRTKTTDDTIKCGGCGGAEFSNICVNCGTTFNGVKCPNCGVEVGEKPRTCHRCGKKTFSVVCTHCGADLLNIEPPEPDQQIIRNVTTININPMPQYSPQKKRRSKGANAVMLLFVVILIAFCVVLGSKNQEKLDKQNAITDLEILSLADHPKFFGDYDRAREFYDGYRKVNISTPAGATNDEKSLLTMAEYDNSNKITYISINFSKSEDIKHGLTIDDVLKVTCEYVPFDILNQSYTFKEALYLTREDNEMEAYYYTMRLNDVEEERKGYLKDKLFIIKILHRSNNDWIVYMEEGTDNWDRDDFVPNFSNAEKWDIDLASYQ